MANANAITSVRVIAPPMIPKTERRDGLLDRAWKIDTAWNLADRVIETLKSKLPSFEAGITVTVGGGPDADLRRVWYLAVSAAFGRLRNRVTGGRNDYRVQGTWDVTGKIARIEIFYTTESLDQTFLNLGERQIVDGQSGPEAEPLVNLFAISTAGIPVGEKKKILGRGVDPRRTPKTFLQRGPEQLTVGAGLPHWLRHGNPAAEAPPRWVGLRCRNRNPAGHLVSTFRVARFDDVFREFPVNVVAGDTMLAFRYPMATFATLADGGGVAGFRNPWVNVSRKDGGGADVVMPDDGRVITTAEKRDVRVQSPTPPVDGRSRCSLLELVSQALDSPCFLPTSAKCTSSLTGHGGLYLWAPGQDRELEDLAVTINTARTTNVVGQAPGVAQGDDANTMPFGAVPDFKN